MALQRNVINKEDNKMSLMWLTHEKPHGAIRFMNETLGIKKWNIFVLIMSQFLCTMAKLALDVPTMAGHPSLPC